jgi:voltage-gated potassium channel Kch
VGTTRGSVARATAMRTVIIISGVSIGVMLLGGTAVWLIERGVPGATLVSWGDSFWWALTTITTTGYGDHVPITLAGRMVGAVVMIAGVAVVGGVAAGVALVVTRAEAHAEEQAMLGEAESERRLESRLDGLDVRLARIEEQLHHVNSRPSWRQL